MSTTIDLTVEQACSVFALQRMSKLAADEANMLRQFHQTDAAGVLDATIKRLDLETERLLLEFRSRLVKPPGLVRPA